MCELFGMSNDQPVLEKTQAITDGMPTEQGIY